MSDTTLNAAIVIIGNEILTGRTQDANTQWIADKLGARGIVLVEVRVVPDIEEKIIKAVNELRAEVDYVFTTGGIGPTHDDITAESIGKALGAEAKHSDEAYQILVEQYGSEDEVTPARARMAVIPEGASLIPNPVSGAPGFVLENVYVMAGVPRIMQGMLDHILPSLGEGVRVLSNTVTSSLPESELAEALGVLQEKHPDVEIGSYPHFRAGNLGLSVVLRCAEEEKLAAATEELIQIVRDHGDEPGTVGLQAPVER